MTTHSSIQIILDCPLGADITGVHQLISLQGSYLITVPPQCKISSEEFEEILTSGTWEWDLQQEASLLIPKIFTFTSGQIKPGPHALHDPWPTILPYLKYFGWPILGIAIMGIVCFSTRRCPCPNLQVTVPYNQRQYTACYVSNFVA